MRTSGVSLVLALCLLPFSSHGADKTKSGGPKIFTSVIDNGYYSSKSIECLDSSGRQVGHPPQKVFMNFTDSQLAWAWIRDKEGITTSDRSNHTLRFKEIGKDMYEVLQTTYAGIACIATGCSEKVGTLKVDLNKNEIEFIILDSIISYCRTNSVAVQRVILDAKAQNKIPDYKETSKIVDNPADHVGPFFHFARYEDGSLIYMNGARAQAYCRNPNFVPQPAHLATTDEMITYAKQLGAAGDWKGYKGPYRGMVIPNAYEDSWMGKLDKERPDGPVKRILLFNSTGCNSGSQPDISTWTQKFDDGTSRYMYKLNECRFTEWNEVFHTTPDSAAVGCVVGQ